MSVIRLGEMRTGTEQVAEMEEFLLSIVPLITGSDGCISCRLFHSQEDPTRFVMIEEWEDVAAHQASVQNIPPEKLAAIRPLLAAPPTGEYFTPVG